MYNVFVFFCYLLVTILSITYAIIYLLIIWFFRIAILAIAVFIVLKLLSFLGVKFATSLLSTLF